MAKTKLSTAEVRAILQAEKSDALSGMESSELSSQRSKAMEYYLGSETLDGDMPPPPDRSKAVSSDVADTVEGLMPSLMEIFASGDDVVQFEPVGQEDEEAAQQETDYINHVFWQKNDGFLTLYSFLKDGLLQKNGIVKVWWEENEEEERESYVQLTDDGYAELLKVVEAAGDKIAEHEEKQEPIPGAEDAIAMAIQQGIDPQTAMSMVPTMATYHDVVVTRTKKYGCARVEPVPPEEFGITRRARSPHVAKADYCFHEVRRTQGDLIAQGYDAAQVEELPDAGVDDTEESQSRDTVDDSNDPSTAAVNRATRLISVTEHYAKLDLEGDGKAKLYKVVTAGSGGEVLKKDGKDDIEPVDFMPFAAATPIIMTHRFFGRSVADLVMDIMRIKTALIRNGLDNIYLANNQRLEIAESHQGDRTIDDLLTNRPGGLVRTKMPGGLMPIPNQDITSAIYPMLEYQDAVREWRTGVTRQGQGIDAKSLADQSATAAAQMFTMAQARMRLIARIFAETGIRDMFLLLHAVIRKHGTSQQETIRLRSKWTPIDPRGWKNRKDMTVNVGIASGSKDQMMMFLLNLLGMQKEAMMAPQTGLAKPTNVYNTLKKVVQLAGLKSIEPYFTDPDEKGPDGQPVNQAPPAPDPKVEMEKEKLALQKQRDEAELAMSQDRSAKELQMKQAESALKQQSDTVKANADAMLAKYKADKEAELARYKADQDMAIRREQMGLEITLKREQLVAEIQLKRELGMMAAMAPQAMPNGAVSDVSMGGEPG